MSQARENGGLSLCQGRVRELDFGSWVTGTCDYVDAMRKREEVLWVIPRFLSGVTRLDGCVETGKEHIGEVIECIGYSLTCI